MEHKLRIKKLSIYETITLFHQNELQGCYKLYSDGSKVLVNDNITLLEIQKHYENGGEFGKELERINLTLPDGTKITAPEKVNITTLGALDELEYELWHTIESYFELFGIQLQEHDSPDWATVKAVQDRLLEILQESGVKFVLPGNDK